MVYHASLLVVYESRRSAKHNFRTDEIYFWGTNISFGPHQEPNAKGEECNIQKGKWYLITGQRTCGWGLREWVVADIDLFPYL